MSKGRSGVDRHHMRRAEDVVATARIRAGQSNPSGETLAEVAKAAAILALAEAVNNLAEGMK